MADTLEIAKSLETAGFDRKQAEALAIAVADSGREKQLREIVEKLNEHDRRFDKLELEIGKIELEIGKLESGLGSLEHKVEAQIAKARFEVVVWTIGALGVLAALLRLFP